MPPAASSSASAQPLLGVTRARRLATDGTRLLDDVTFRLDRGEGVALTGPSGAGKSLLLRALVLLDPLDGGHVEWLGSTVPAAQVPEFRRRLLYLPQTPTMTDATVLEQLELPWTFQSAKGSRLDRAAALDLLARSGRDEGFLDQRGDNLSGGEAQLVALIRALLLVPFALLLDEPTAAMDAVTRAAAEAMLNDWRAGGEDRSWVWVSHDPQQLERMCSRSVQIAAGGLSS